MTDLSENLQVYAKMWNLMRSMNEVGLANEGYELIRAMCSDCIQKRESACVECKILHEKLDAIEKMMPHHLLMEPFTFERTIQEQLRLQHIK